MHPYKRSQRVAELLKEVVAQIIHEDLKDLPADFVTVTGVEMSEDLSCAKIFFTVLGSDQVKTETERKLRQSAAYIKSLIGKRIRLKYMPELQFRYDTAFATAQRIDHILDNLKQEQPAPGHDES